MGKAAGGSNSESFTYCVSNSKMKGCNVSDIVRPLLLDYKYKLFNDGLVDKDGKLVVKQGGLDNGK